MAIGELVEMAKEKRKKTVRKGVLEALLKVYTAREMARLDTCPLCGWGIKEYTWTITNFKEDLDPIGLSGAQCVNTKCLLHSGIIYEDEAKRLAEWQEQLKDWVNKDFEGDEKSLKKGKDDIPDRFKQQLVADRRQIEKMTTMMDVIEASVSSSKGGKTIKLEMKLKSRPSDELVHATSLGRLLLSEIEDLGYMISWVDAEWRERRMSIIIEKDVWINE